MTRSEAIEEGLAIYHTGKVCRNGHDAPRYTSSGSCVECTAERGYGRNRKPGKKVRTPQDDFDYAAEILNAGKEVWEE